MGKPDYINTLLLEAGAPNIPKYLRPKDDEITISVSDIISKAALLY